jgi:hypothetical protein
MADTQTAIDQEALRRRWQERCSKGDFSAAVLGIGTVRVFGRSGDAPVQFPRIATLAALDTLEPDEQWALHNAREIVTTAQARNRPVMATQPPRGGVPPAPTPIRAFDPKLEHILILSLTTGG